MGDMRSAIADDEDDCYNATEHYGLLNSDVFRSGSPYDTGRKLVVKLWRDHAKLTPTQVAALVQLEYKQEDDREEQRTIAEEVKQLHDLLNKHGLPRDWATAHGWHKNPGCYSKGG